MPISNETRGERQHRRRGRTHQWPTSAATISVKPRAVALAVPVPLELAGQLDPADGNVAGLQAGAVGLAWRAAHRVDHDIDVESFLQGVKCGEDRAGLRPQRDHDQLFPAGRPDG